ncbi:DNA-binding transcriptional regulator [Campylobacterota bacterium]|nr:DNA-binding transcriptional regulator [Campylobacterota bacterium]
MYKERAQYDRLYEVIEIINEMTDAGVGVSYEQLQQKYGWGRRTAERMVRTIEQLYPSAFEKTVDGKRAYFKLAKQPVLPPIYIDQTDIATLHTAARYMEQHKEIFAKLNALSHKLTAMDKCAERYMNNIEQLTMIYGIASAPRPFIKLDEKIIASLQNAVIRSSEVNITHLDREITTQPLGFLYGGKSYLVAGDPKSPRLFLLHNITAVEILDSSFDADNFDINKFASASFGVYREGKIYNVKLIVSAQAAASAKMYRFHPTQQFTDQADGRLLIEFSADGLLEMCNHIFTWRGEMIPIEPQELVDQYNELLEAAKKSMQGAK